MGLLLDTLLPTLIPVLIGLIVPHIMRAVKFFAVFVDNLAAPLQQVLVVLISWGLVQVAVFLNVVIPTDITLITSGDISGALAAAVAFAVHAGSKKS